MAKRKDDGKKILYYLLLILALIIGGVLVIEFAGRITGVNITLPGMRRIKEMALKPKIQTAEDPYLLEREELSKIEERIKLQEEYLLNRENEIDAKEVEVDKQIEAVKEREKELDLKVSLLAQEEKARNNRQRNIREQAEKLFNMPPKSAVEILEQQDEIDIVDILRGIDEYAAEIGSASTASYLLTLFEDKTKAGNVFRKLQYYSEEMTAVDILEDENLEEVPNP